MRYMLKSPLKKFILGTFFCAFSLGFSAENTEKLQGEIPSIATEADVYYVHSLMFGLYIDGVTDVVFRDDSKRQVQEGVNKYFKIAQKLMSFHKVQHRENDTRAIHQWMKNTYKNENQLYYKLVKAYEHVIDTLR